jgi:hypothetical protein
MVAPTTVALFWRIAPALLFIALWYCFSIGITFFNKWLFHVCGGLEP